ncbi:universal stress protein UspA [Meridianimarinicoccus roseus]|jgi:nucleotide-binding universal stress UspA family protein|uniref:Universal stress protein UspA n=1 Tax=Meridianimarinicoccus roseus TaxID=2072018 RepID=A0A2V2LK51_9RHOB|nr:universal stress protein [Meridianimarinicoccus roseus]PWR03497.1 universal stress protein UspA [Meridianimarinicoccus roseus]
MYTHIMVPVDLAHADRLPRALETAALLGRAAQAKVTYVGVTAETPTGLGHNPDEYADRLAQFAQEQGEQHGITTAARAYASHDPAIDLNDTLLKAADDLEADCIVIASHIPNVADHLWPSHGGAVARRAKASVFVVR